MTKCDVLIAFGSKLRCVSNIETQLYLVSRLHILFHLLDHVLIIMLNKYKNATANCLTSTLRRTSDVDGEAARVGHVAGAVSGVVRHSMCRYGQCCVGAGSHPCHTYRFIRVVCHVRVLPFGS